MQCACSGILKLLDKCVIVSTAGGVKVSETKNLSSKCRSVTIKNCTGRKIVIKLDEFAQFSPYIDPHHKLANKSCDGVVLCTYKNRKFVLFVELKSDSPKKWLQQLRNSECFFQYLCSLLELHHGIDMSEFEKIYLLCTTSYAQKKTVATHKKQDPIDDCPEKCFILPCNMDIYLDNLNI